MSIATLSALALTIVFVGIAYYIYVSVIQARNYAQTQLSNIDIQLRRRLDTVPNLLRVARKFMVHEKQLLDDITKLRSQAASTSAKQSPQKAFDLNRQLSSKVGSFMVSVEGYPEMKSDSVTQKAMTDLSLIEEDISAARRLYNGAVLDFNNKFDIFPYNIVAAMLSFSRMTPYEDKEPDQVRQSINVDDHL